MKRTSVLDRLDTWTLHLDERTGLGSRLLFRHVDWHLRRASRNVVALDAASRWRHLRAYRSLLDRNPAYGRARQRAVMLIMVGGAVGGGLRGAAGGSPR